MKIKLVADVAVGDFEGVVEPLVAGSVLEVDDTTGAEMIAAGVAEAYSEEVVVEEEKAVEKEVVKSMKKEVKIQVTKDAPLFKGMGDFLGAVVKAGRGQVDERLLKSTGQNEATPADGGYTVTTDLAKYITQQASEASVMEAKCSKLEIGPNYTGIKIPQVNETTRSATTLYAGVRVYAPAEGVAKTPFKQAYTQKDIQLKKLCAVNYLTDELIQDNTALVGFIRMNVGKAFAWAKDNEIVNATLSAATAIVNNAACAEVTVAGDNPTAAEIAEIFAKNINRNRAEWFISTSQYAALIALASTGTFPMFQPNYAVAPMGTLLGRPINVIEQAGVDTDESSFMFLDLSDYLVIGKGGIDEATSIHVKFLEDETCFRWTTRFGGAPLMASTVTLPDGSVVSSFVTRD